MAFTEDLITRLRADTSDFEGKMQAATTTAQGMAAKTATSVAASGAALDSSLKQTTAGYLKFGNAARATAMAMEGFAAGGDRATFALASLGPQLTNLTAGLAQSGSAMAGLATTALPAVGMVGALGAAAAMAVPVLIQMGTALGDWLATLLKIPPANAVIMAQGELLRQYADQRLYELKREVEVREELESANEAFQRRAATERLQRRVGELSEEWRARIELLKRLMADDRAFQLEADRALEAERNRIAEAGLQHRAAVAARWQQQADASRARYLETHDEFGNLRGAMFGVPAAEIAAAGRGSREMARAMEIEALTAVNPLIEENVELQRRQAEAQYLSEQAILKAAEAQTRAAESQRKVTELRRQALMSEMRTTILVTAATALATGAGVKGTIDAIKMLAVVEAAKNIAYAVSAAANPFTAPLAAGYYAAATKWGIVAGVAAGASMAAGGGGGASTSGGGGYTPGEGPGAGGGVVPMGTQREQRQTVEINIYVPVGGRQAGAREIVTALRELAADDGRTVNEILAGG